MRTDDLRDLLGDLAGERPPLYAALAGRLRMLVGDGRVPVGERLPAERDLAAALHLSRATVAAAYGLLREQGWAGARQGAGTWTRLPADGTAGHTAGAWLPAPPQPGVVDLAHAAPPAPPQVPAAFAAALEDLPRHLPGHGYHPEGLPDLRARIAERYAVLGLPTRPEQVLVTSGALHAVTVAVETLTRRGDRVVVEHPTYPNALDAVRLLGRRPVPAAVDADDPGGTVRALTQAARGSGATAAYLMPDHQNPTGLVLDEAPRRRLAVGLAAAGTVAVVDETMADLELGDPAGHVGPAGPAGPARRLAPPMAALAGPATVVTAGTLSKSIWGGLRVGWLRADDPALVRRLAAALGRTQLSGPVLEQLAAVRLLDQVDDVLATGRAALRTGRASLLAALAEQLPEWEVRVPSGGLVLWCRLPGLSSTSLAGVAEQRGLLLAAGPRFGTGHAFDDRLRLPYTQPPEVLERGVRLLAEVAADLPRRPVPAPARDLVL